jgi:phosphatidylserine/phosphatidylglycerophosphate/cardiolipin synthase-like enzyme
MRTGNTVRPLVDGLPAFRRIGEAIDRTRHSIWLTVAFYSSDFSMPDGRGSLFDVLDRAAARALDVRVIFWRPTPNVRGDPGAPHLRGPLRMATSLGHEDRPSGLVGIARTGTTSITRRVG